jgi:hypothetical protein
MANTYLTRTPSSAGNRKTFTISAWIKRANISAITTIFSTGANSTTNGFLAFFLDTDGFLQTYIYESTNKQIKTNARYRDVNGYYHVILAVDTTQATASNRVKFYVNGEQITDLTLVNGGYPSQNFTTEVNNTVEQRVGAYRDSSGTLGSYWNGVISHYHNIDGTAYDPSAFGSTDATTGEWKINTNPNVTYGTNGFFILKDGNSVTDQSPNTNNFTVAGGTLTKTEDCPSNVFATLNAIQESPANNSLSNGNTTSTNDGSASGHKLRVATLGASSGKYYAEFKLPNGGSNYAWCGIISYDDFNNPDTYMGSSQNSISYGNGGTILRNDSTLSSQGQFPTIGGSTVLQVALDLDNNFVYFGIDGTYVNSGNPTSGASGTGGYSINFSAGKTYTFGVSGNNTGATWNCNFGNGFFSTTAVSSNSGNGYSATGSLGIFQYQPPTGYTALCTKGLNL